MNSSPPRRPRAAWYVALWRTPWMLIAIAATVVIAIAMLLMRGPRQMSIFLKFIAEAMRAFDHYLDADAWKR